MAEYIEPARPVVLTDAARHWPAIGKFTPEFFRQHYGHLTKTVAGVTYTLAEYTDLMQTATPERPAPYPFHFNVARCFPNLLADMKPELLYGKSDRIHHPLLPRFMLHNTEVYEIFFGSRGASFPCLHFDALYMHTQITQLYGAKEFILFPPNQTPYLYPLAENNKLSAVNVLEPDYERFPLFEQARPITVTLEEGETLFFPSGWWHTTRIHEPCITLGRAQLNANNWAAFSADNVRILKQHRPALALATELYARGLGKLMDAQEWAQGW